VWCFLPHGARTSSCSCILGCETTQHSQRSG
jgi:hypothetical protein